MSNFDLSTMLTEAGARMRSGLASQLVPHFGERGAGREEVLRRFLSDYLPKRFLVDTGFVFDHSGACSNQMDIVIVDSAACPLFEDAGGRKFYPVEGVVAVGQVRSSATSLEKWQSALDNLESVKVLDRSGGGHSCSMDDGMPLNHEDDHLDQVFSFLFVCGESLTPYNARHFMLDYLGRRSAHLWPNICFVFDNYLLTFCCDYGICPNPMHAIALSLQTELSQNETFIRFYLMLAQAVQFTRTGRLPYHSYLASFKPWNAEFFPAARVDSPPKLRDIL